ncbi:hypothetical protein SEUCBS139899_010174 [Sporothrix eucalyptigena]
MDDTAVEITYRSSDLQPPLWLAGSFSNPPWTPIEMQHKTAPNGEHVFTKAIYVKPGSSIQYKFRVGSGDWWVLDEGKPTVTDDMGNRNNVLKVNDKPSVGVNTNPPTPPPDSPVFRTAGLAEPTLQVPGGPSRSNASTPGFVRTTMEVADTAAQIDAGTPESAASEPDGVPDESFDYLDVDIGPEFPHERPGEEDDDQDGAPVFAYEFAGTYEAPVNPALSDHSPRSQAVADDDPDFDPSDPTLERFPSNRDEILSRVRTLETGLNEDVTTFEGYPASPVVSPGRKSSIGSIDATGDFFSLSPTSMRPQGGRRSDPNKRNTNRDSLVLDPSASPSPSLQCIVEETATDDRQDELLPEAIGTEPLSPKSVPAKLVEAPVSPTIIVHRATEDENTNSVNGTEDTPDNHPGAFPETDENDGPSNEVAQADGNRNLSGGASHSTGIEASKDTNWFAAFIRVVFVDWLGSFLGKLLRWRRS